MQIGEKLRSIRKLKGFSQDYLADQLNISQVTYSQIENNKTKLNLDRLEDICAILDVTLEDLLSFDEKQIFNNSFKDSSSGFFNVQKVITESFDNERKIYNDKIQFLKDEIRYLRNKLDK